MIRQTLTNLDLIGPVPSLYYNSKPKYQSVIGGVFTILTGLLSILAFVGFGYNLLAKQNPVSVYSRELNTELKIKYNDTFFLFAPHLPYGGRVNVDFARKFKMTFRYINTDGQSPERASNITYFVERKMVPCAEVQKYKDNLYDIKSQLVMPLEDYYCISDDFDIPLTDKFGTAKFGMYGIYLDYCDNSTMNGTCYPIDQVKSMYSMLNMHMISLTYYIDSKDYEKPLKPSYVSNIHIGSTTGSRTDTYFFKNTDVKTDEGWILESIDNKPTFEFHVASNTAVPANPGDSIHFIIISIDNLRDIYTRNYLKLQDILASAGGFVEIFLLFFSVVNNYLQANRMYQKMYLQILDNLVTKHQERKHLSEKTKTSIPTTENFIETKRHPSEILYEYKSSYKKLNVQKHIFPFLYAKKSNNLKILSRLGKSVMKQLSVDKMLLNYEVNKIMNKALWGDNGYGLIKFASIVNFVDKLADCSQQRKDNEIHDLNKMLQDVQSSRVVDLHDIIRNVYDRINPERKLLRANPIK
jgi:hypothetical protein